MLLIVALDELGNLREIEEVGGFAFVGRFDAGIDILALKIGKTGSVGGVSVGEAVGRGVVEHAAGTATRLLAEQEGTMRSL